MLDFIFVGASRVNARYCLQELAYPNHTTLISEEEICAHLVEIAV